MIHWAWLIIAFMLGGLIGFGTMCLLVISSDDPYDCEDSLDTH